MWVLRLGYSVRDAIRYNFDKITTTKTSDTLELNSIFGIYGTLWQLFTRTDYSCVLSFLLEAYFITPLWWFPVSHPAL